MKRTTSYIHRCKLCTVTFADPNKAAFHPLSQVPTPPQPPPHRLRDRLYPAQIAKLRRDYSKAVSLGRGQQFIDALNTAKSK